MEPRLKASCFTRSLLPGLFLLVFGSCSFAQSPAIEPCQATPSTNSTPSAPSKIEVGVKETVIDSSLADDPSLQKLIGPYAAKVRALDLVIGTLASDLTKSGVGANNMGNLVADAIRVAAKAKSNKHVVLAITNAGGLRKTLIPAGELKTANIFEMLPFENTLIEVDVTGAQLLELMKRLTNARDAQSGARIEFRWNEQGRPELISGKLIDESRHETEVDPKATYTIVTIDYLLKLASGNYAVLQEAKHVTPLNVTVRDAVIDYIKAATAAGRKIDARLDQRFVQVGPSPARTETPR